MPVMDTFDETQFSDILKELARQLMVKGYAYEESVHLSRPVFRAFAKNDVLARHGYDGPPFILSAINLQDHGWSTIAVCTGKIDLSTASDIIIRELEEARARYNGS